MRKTFGYCLIIWMMFTINCRAMQLPATVSQEEALAALKASFSVLGTRYVWGGQTPRGFDCSGLAIWAYNQVLPDIRWRLGVAEVLDTTAHGLYVYNSIPVQPSEVWPGDLVFVTSSNERVTHMGLFSRWLSDEHTKFEWVQASSLHKGVVVSTWYLGQENDGKRLVGVGRVVKWPLTVASSKLP